MKILLTGAEGFVGKRLRAALEKDGHVVSGFDIVNGDDILDERAVEAAVKEVDAVYHIAAQADVTKIVDAETSKICTDINVLGTYNMARACAESGKLLIYASTCC